MSLRELKEEIEKMSKHHQIEILKLLCDNNSYEYLNENQNGTFINLTSLPSDIIEKMQKYCKYVSEQQENLSMIEQEKQRIEQEFFS